MKYQSDKEELTKRFSEICVVVLSSYNLESEIKFEIHTPV
jgi:hypothetical protein